MKAADTQLCCALVSCSLEFLQWWFLLSCASVLQQHTFVDPQPCMERYHRTALTCTVDARQSDPHAELHVLNQLTSGQTKPSILHYFRHKTFTQVIATHTSR